MVTESTKVKTDPAFLLTAVEKVVGWALSHHFMHFSEVLVKDAKLIISTERLSTFSWPHKLLYQTIIRKMNYVLFYCVHSGLVCFILQH